MSTASFPHSRPAAGASLTIDPAAKDSYWRVVEECLVQFHGFDPLRAINEGRAARRRFEAAPPGVSGDLIYHTEPFYTACDLAGLADLKEQERLLANRRPDYDLILSANDW